VSDVIDLVIGTLQGIGGIVAFLLVLMIGLCLLLDWTKFRPTRKSKTIKSLDELVGPQIQYLPPDAPRGRVDQLAASSR
jgi:hypothetical protein